MSSNNNVIDDECITEIETLRKSNRDLRNGRKDLQEQLAACKDRNEELECRMMLGTHIMSNEEVLSQLEASKKTNMFLETRVFEYDQQIEQLKQQVEQLKQQIAKNEMDRRPELDLSKELSGDDDDDSSVETKKDSWTIQFRKLRCYREMNGDCKVPQGYKQDRSLGKWVTNQRTAYGNTRQGKKGPKLTPERIAKLDGIDFYWGKKYEEKRPSFEEYLDQLKDFKDIFGHCNVPPTQGLLGKFVSRIRGEFRRYKKGKGSLFQLEQFKQLHKIGFSFQCK